MLSSDFRACSMGFLITGLLEKLPKGKISWYAYSNSVNDHSRIRERIRSGFDHFINVTQLTDEELVDRIYKDQIDILFDLNMMTGESRASILQYRPAPIQIPWLRMPGTLGAKDAADYIIGDAFVTPLTEADGFDEKILQLPRSYEPNDDQPPNLALAKTRADHNLPEDKIIFCCFNQQYKFSPDTFVLWGKILQAVPHSILWLMKPDWIIHDEVKGIQARLKKQLEGVGISSDRVVLATLLPQAEHIARLRHADLILDTLPYNAHTTCSDALRAGTPVVTLPGNTFAGRVGASILSTAHLQEWIAKDADDYVQKAVAYASLPREKINAIKAKVSETYWASPMPDNVAFAHLFENMCLNLYNRYVQRKPITHLRVTQEGDLIELA